jgi:hypothetical protein
VASRLDKRTPIFLTFGGMSSHLSARNPLLFAVFVALAEERLPSMSKNICHKHRYEEKGPFARQATSLTRYVKTA